MLLQETIHEQATPPLLPHHPSSTGLPFKKKGASVLSVLPQYSQLLAVWSGLYVKYAQRAVEPHVVQHSVTEFVVTFWKAFTVEPPFVHVELSQAVDNRMLAAAANVGRTLSRASSFITTECSC